MMKWFKRTIYILVLLAVLALVLDAALIFGFAHYRPEIKKADSIIVLGAAINSKAAQNRALEGLRLYEDGKSETIVASGGKIADSDISEAQYMKKVIDKNAKAPVKVILEDKSGNTRENIKNSKEKLPEAKSVIIVSDAFHLARGVMLAKNAGFEDVSWSSPSQDYYPEKELRYYYFREFFAMLNYLPVFLRD